MFVKENKKAAPQLAELHKGDNINDSNTCQKNFEGTSR